MHNIRKHNKVCGQSILMVRTFWSSMINYEYLHHVVRDYKVAGVIYLVIHIQ